jgi:hypothetical protein
MRFRIALFAAVTVGATASEPLRHDGKKRFARQSVLCIVTNVRVTF